MPFLYWLIQHLNIDIRKLDTPPFRILRRLALFSKCALLLHFAFWQSFNNIFAKYHYIKKFIGNWYWKFQETKVCIKYAEHKVCIYVFLCLIFVWNWCLIRSQKIRKVFPIQNHSWFSLIWNYIIANTVHVWWWKYMYQGTRERSAPPRKNS